MAISDDVGRRVAEYLQQLEDIRYIHTEKFDPEVCLCPQHQETNWSFIEAQLMCLSIPDVALRPTSDHHWYYTRFTVFFRHLRVADYCENFMSSSIFEILNYLMKFIAAGVKGSRMWVISHVQVEYFYTKNTADKAP